MIYFVGAGCGDPELITLKGYKLLQKADAILYTGSLVPKEILNYAKDGAVIRDSQNMKYEEIFNFLDKFKDKICVRLHTGDPTLYSTIAKQIEFLKAKNIAFEIVAGVSAVFGASSSLEIEYTIPSLSQNLIISRVEGNTPNPEPLENILKCKNSSLVFYLSIQLISKLKAKALELNYPLSTPCYVIEKATWSDEKIYKGTLEDIEDKVKHIKGVALILLGEFLTQKERSESILYN